MQNKSGKKRMRGKIGKRETSSKMTTLYSDISVIILTDTSKNSK